MSKKTKSFNLVIRTNATVTAHVSIEADTLEEAEEKLQKLADGDLTTRCIRDRSFGGCLKNLADAQWKVTHVSNEKPKILSDWTTITE